MITQEERIKGTLLGLAVGDALGVPVEFTSRYSLEQNPVVGMRGYGTHDQPPGTWSDDASLTFCLAESIAHGFSLGDLANRFVNWLEHGYWTPYGHIFDVGIATRQAITRLQKGISPVQAGMDDEYSNGNGSLMRILPLVFLCRHQLLADRISTIQDVSSLTHRHIRSVIGCVLYVEYANLLMTGTEKFVAYEQLCRNYKVWLEPLLPPEDELGLYSRVTQGRIPALSADEVRGSGYILHSLEASLWCFLTTESYKEAVLKAVNLGEDTDTTGAITGGLAGLYYGSSQIPARWVESLARQRDITHLAKRLAATVGNLT